MDKTVSEQPLVSVIVPVYNVEPYLEECLQSLVNQTYSEYVLILVDDGSTDESGNICDKYGADYAQVTVYHKVNGGLSDARNYGVNRANSELIVFVDADDYVSPRYIEYLVDLRQKYRADVSIAACRTFSDGNKVFVSNDETDYREECMDTVTALNRMCYVDGFGVSAWAKLYDRKLLLKYPYPYGRLHEDLDTTYKIIGDCQTIAYGECPVYYYRQRASSITHQHLSNKHLYGLTAAEHQYEYMKQYYPECVKAANYLCVMETFVYISRLLDQSQRSKFLVSMMRRRMKKYCVNAITDKKMKLPFKLKCTYVMMPYCMMMRCWRLHEKLKTFVGQFRNERYKERT
jgi:glycosyltransferase involved in cell wall biosynthesis